MMGCAAILVDITPGAKVPAAIVGKATRPAVPTRDVMTVLPAIVIAGTKRKDAVHTCILWTSPKKQGLKPGDTRQLISVSSFAYPFN